MSSEFWQAEFARQLGNIIQPGKVVELDAANARVKVEIGGNKTGWIPWMTHAAGKDRQWSAPEPGEQVLVLAPTGDTAQGFVLRGIYSTAYPAPANSADVSRTQWDGGAFVQYDRATKTHTLNVPSGGSIRLVCGSSTVEVKNGEVAITADLLKITAPNTTTTGAIDAAGEVYAGPNNVGLASHKHTGVVPGGGTSGGPVP